MTREDESSTKAKTSGHPRIVDTSTNLPQDEEAQARLSNYLADQLFTNVDVQAELEQTLAPRLAPLAGPAAGALRRLVLQVAERALDTPQFESLWSQANRSAHESPLKILNDEGSTVSTGGGGQLTDSGFRGGSRSPSNPVRPRWTLSE